MMHTVKAMIVVAVAAAAGGCGKKKNDDGGGSARAEAAAVHRGNVGDGERASLARALGVPDHAVAAHRDLTKGELGTAAQSEPGAGDRLGADLLVEGAGDRSPRHAGGELCEEERAGDGAAQRSSGRMHQ